MARCVKTPVKERSQHISPMKAAQDRLSPIKPPPRRLGGVGCFRRCAPTRTEGLYDDLDVSVDGAVPTATQVSSTGTSGPGRPSTADLPRLSDAIAAYTKLLDAEERLVEVFGLDGLRRHRRRRDVVDDRACDKPCWGLDDDLDDQPACWEPARCPIS